MILNKFIIKSNSTILDAVDKISLNSYRTAIVVNNKKVIGVISEGDVLKAILNKTDLNAKVTFAMNKSFIFLKLNQEELAKKIFKKHLIGIIPILNKKMELKKILKLDHFI